MSRYSAAYGSAVSLVFTAILNADTVNAGKALWEVAILLAMPFCAMMMIWEILEFSRELITEEWDD